MSNVTSLYEGQRHDDVHQCFGTVIESSGEILTVWAGERRSARRAASCLIAPKTGDRVLVAVDHGHAYVLAVLEHSGDEPLTVSAPGDGDLTLRARTLRVSAQDSLDLVSSGALRGLAARLSLRAPEAEIALENTTFVGGLLRAQLRKAQLLTEAIDTVADRWVQRVKRSYRSVRDTDQLRAGTIDHRAEQLLALRGEHTVMTARELVKVDGSQIHVG